ncbi:hypothetical protein BKA91DRAFT_134370 [Yarrowia lipolytica]|nr:hypothetical protein BKA91DRAFT_134370 [Yarrowia lipolytica]
MCFGGAQSDILKNHSIWLQWRLALGALFVTAVPSPGSQVPRVVQGDHLETARVCWNPRWSITEINTCQCSSSSGYPSEVI